ncbi:MAG: clpX 1 [Planctomycetota bacterium]|nr:clpX 1 [Planctomycetota bacterium]
MSSAQNTPVPQPEPRPTPPPTWADLLGSVPSPKSLVAHLDRHVVGQQAAKRKLAVAVSSHFRRLADGQRCGGRVIGPDPLDDAPDLIHVPIERSNLLLIGPTGSGKTLLVQALAKALNVPVVIGDATTFTEAGYVGDDVENLLVRLLLAAGGEFGPAQRGIIFIDEIDKLRKYHGHSGMSKDPTGQGVQHALLKMMESWVSFIPTKLGPRHPEAETVPFDTTDVLFIYGGAFPGLEDIISRRLGRDAGGFGFGAATDHAEVEGDLLRHVLPCDLEAFGMIPELLGRLPVIATLDDLGVDHLVRILTDPANALLKQYRKLLRLSHGADLEFTPKAVQEVARMAYERGTGARGLRAIVEQVVEGVMFEASEADRGQTFVIDERVVRGEGTTLRTPIRAVPPLRTLLRKRVSG